MDLSELCSKIKDCDALIATMNQSPLKTTIQSAQSILETNNNIIKSIYSPSILQKLNSHDIPFLNSSHHAELSEAPHDMPQEERAMLIEELNSNLSKVHLLYYLIYYYCALFKTWSFLI